MRISLQIWRQSGPDASGKMVRYELEDVAEHMSFLEVLDVLNEKIILEGGDPVAFDHDCREGICGTCSMIINGQGHGPQALTTTCQLHMRQFKDGDEIAIEPFRAKGFPLVRDLVVDRSAFDRIVAAGGYVSINTGNAPDAGAIPVGKEASDLAMDAASCIGCGACVAQCPNGAANLFTAAKISHLNLLPQGIPEKDRRSIRMVEQMEVEAFGACSNFRECEAVCPKGIDVDFIARMNRDYLTAKIRSKV